MMSIIGEAIPSSGPEQPAEDIPANKPFIVHLSQSEYRKIFSKGPYNLL